VKPLIVANWKMRMTVVKAIQFVQKFREEVQGSNADVVLCAPSTTLSALRYELQKGSGGLTIQVRKPISLGAQNMHFQEEGAFTGEISPSMVKELADFVILGHSERRLLFHEQDVDVHKKIVAAHNVGLIPIVCFGAFVGEKEGTVSTFIEKELDAQLRGCLNGLDLSSKRIVIAYEPTGAVDSGNAADPQRMNHIFYFIRRFLAQHFGETVARATPLLYGGSVTSKNSASFLQCKEIDGLLVGSASVSAEEFSRIVKLC
jgi:triosephosphate isomerase (TIM)